MRHSAIPFPEHTLFNSVNRSTTLNLTIDQYNENVAKTETDLSLRIGFEAKWLTAQTANITWLHCNPMAFAKYDWTK